MKKKETPLHFAQQLETFQTARKAKEVNEISKFDTLKEGLKQRHLTLNRRMDKLHQKFLQQHIEESEIAQEQSMQEKVQILQDIAEFEQQAYDTHVNAPDSEFETIAAIQGFRYRVHGSHHELKQLPEAQSDAFVHELAALTERELQKELEQNEKSLQESLKKPGRLELSSESRSKEPEPQPASFEQERQEESEQKSASSEAELDVQKNPEQESTPEKKKSEGSLIYFRQNPPSSEQ